MEQGCHDSNSIDGAVPSTDTLARGCSPDQHECSSLQEEPSDIATEVTLRATTEPTVSFLICRGLQTIHGAPEKEQPEPAWEEEKYEVAQQQIQQHQESTNEGESSNNAPLQHEQMLEPYAMPMQV